MAKDSDNLTVTERLIAEMWQSGVSVREIGRRSGVNHASLTRFVNGDRGLSVQSINALAKALGLQLTKRRQKG